MIYTKFKSEEFFIKSPFTKIKIKNFIPLDITPSEIILKIRKIEEINQKKKEIDKYMRDLEKLNVELIHFNYSFRVKSLTELVSIREKIFTESCNK